MIRDFIINGAKAPDAMHKAKVAMVTGMAVVKEDSETEKYANITSAETVADIFFVDKERIPTGINTARGDMSDYDPDFVYSCHSGGGCIRSIVFPSGYLSPADAGCRICGR